MTILISGGAGFIGSSVLKFGIAQGLDFRVLDNLSPQIHGEAAVPPALLRDPAIDFQRGSVESVDDWCRALEGTDTVIHLAAETGTGQSMYEVGRYVRVNVQGTAELFEALGRSKTRSIKRVILASSRSIYGEGAYTCASCGLARLTPPARRVIDLRAGHWEPLCPTCSAPLRAIPTREDDPPSTASIYAATKYAQEDLVRIGCDALGIDYAILRFQNVYGEGQSLKNPYTGILSIFSTRIRRGLHLPLFEDGHESRDFIHVDDVAEAVLRAATLPTPVATVINVGSGVAASVATVASGLSTALGVTPDLRVTGQFRFGDIRHNLADITRLQDILCVVPRVGLTEGLRRFCAWVQTQVLPEDRLDQANRELASRGLMGEGR